MKRRIEPQPDIRVFKYMTADEYFDELLGFRPDDMPNARIERSQVDKIYYWIDDQPEPELGVSYFKTDAGQVVAQTLNGTIFFESNPEGGAE